MEIEVAAAGQYGDAPDCIREASEKVRQAKQLLSQPAERNAEESAALLREAEIQLGCACAYYRAHGCKPDHQIQITLQALQTEIASLAQFFSLADRFLGDWLRAIGPQQAGYTTRGQAAPLVLMKKVSLEG
jgi:hypothetical protein